MNDPTPIKHIAVIGLGCRFPHAETPEAFWEMLAQGACAIEEQPAERRFPDGPPEKGSFLKDAYFFDNDHFNIPDDEALFMDPQQRLLLELAVETMESAGYDSLKDQRAGVFIGANQMAYSELITSQWHYANLTERIQHLESFANLPAPHRDALLHEIDALRQYRALPPNTLAGNLVNMIAGRISHELNLKGPSLSMDTACSSSLVAVHWACESLSGGACDLAFAGGVNLNLTPAIFRYMQAAGVLSPTGRCIPFSGQSDGILLGEGAGLVLLKRLDDALRDGNAVYAVIKGWGVNNDGRSISVMAPSWKGQLALMQSVYEGAGYDPSRISALEAHGTSTRVGDGVERSVIERFFARPDRPLSIGSVKSNIGHALGAAGIAGLLKMILAIHRRQLPPSLHEDPDPKWKLAEKGIRIQSEREDWRSEGPLACGVSSFGFGGTNAHVILEEPPAVPGPLPVPKTIFRRKHFRFDPLPFPGPANEFLASLTWRTSGQPDQKPVFQPAHWLLFCEEEKLRQELQEALTARGATVFFARRTGDEPAPSFTRTGEHAFSIDPINPDHYRWLLAGIGAHERLGILWVADQLPVDPVSLVDRGLSPWRRLFQAAAQSAAETRIWTVTFDAFRVDEKDRVDPAQQALAALAGGAFAENEPLRGGLLDLSSTSPDRAEWIAKILGTIPAQPLVIRNGRHFTPVLEPARSRPSAPRTLSIRTNGVYVVLGGSSGVGAELAAHFCRRGAGKVIVSGSRREADIAESLRPFRPDRITYVQSSVLEASEIQSLLQKVVKEHGRIDGIVYAAGKIDYGSFVRKEQAAFREVLLAKIAGVHHLQQAVRELAPGFVYLLGSVSGLAPAWAKGLAAYGAANAYLSATAMALNTLETVWTTGSWGRWEGTGMAAAITGDPAGALSSLPVDDALTAFDDSLRLGLPHLAILPPADRTTFSFSYPVVTTPIKAPSVSALENGQTSRTTAPPVASPGKPPVNGTPDLRSLIVDLLAQTLKIPPAEINETASFYDLGLDSLDAIDIVKKVEAQMGFILEPTLLFEHDSVAALAGHLKRLKDQKAETGAEPAPDAPVPTKPLADPFPLLPAQQTFYVSQRFYPADPCNMLVRLDLEKTLDRDQLRAAWAPLIQKHSVLRLGFRMTDQGPRQQPQTPAAAFSPEYYRFPSREENAGEIRELEERFVNHLFSLEEPPLYRLAQIDLASGGSSLLFVIHHLVADAWSVQLLLSECLENYRRLQKGLSINAKPLPLSFERYADLRRQQPAIRDRPADAAYWRAALSNAPATLPLPYREEGEKDGIDAGYRSVSWEIDRPATKRLLRQAGDWNATPFQVLLAAYYLLLLRLTRREDLIIRVAVANRELPIPGIEELTGCLADSIPLRVRLTLDDSLETATAKVRDHLLEAQKHAGLSAAELAALPAERPAAGPAGISPAGMSFLPFHHLSKESDRTWPRIHCRSALTFTDLSLICILEDGRLSGSWNFSAQKFKRETIEDISRNYIEILADRALSRSQPPPSLPPPLEMPAAQLFPQTQFLHEKVWLACRRYADRTAIVDGEEKISYADLQRRAYQVANTLIERVDDRQKVAGILAYPGAPAVYGILGILAAGRAFIPFDPDWPDARMLQMIEHAGLETMATTTAIYERLAQSETLRDKLKCIVLVDGPAEGAEVNGIRVCSCLNADAGQLLSPPAPVAPDDLAYVMYTSGTSGRPKGVMVQHRAVEVFLNWVSETFAVTETDRFIHTSSLGFGGSIRQIFSTLLAGATIYPIPRLEFKDPQGLLNFLERHEITLLNTVPTSLNNMLEWLAQTEGEERKTTLPALRLILVGGEAVFAKTIAQWRSRFGERHAIVNMYGSTETIVNATIYPIDAAATARGGGIPIGYQKKGNLVRLINERGELCRPGEPGELYVGGPCLSKGYFREPELTAERFVHLDHLGLPGIFYRMGDLARADADGLYHYLGRNDDQIQIYGNRVELIEIEEALYRTQKVKAAAVVDLQTDRNHWLVAFVELNRADAGTPGRELRAAIADQLPAYMVPHQVISLEKMPRNHAGKTDRKALRQRFAAEFLPEAERTQAGATEAKVTAVWEQFLRTGPIGPDDDFFALGGDSILALEMLHQLRKDFPQVPPPIALFRGRTVRNLAAELDKLRGEAPAAPEPFSKDVSPTPMMSLSPSQKGFAALQKLDPSSSPNWVALLPLRGRVEEVVLQKALDYLLKRHEMLRAEFVVKDGHTWQRIRPAGAFSLVYRDVSDRTPEAREALLQRAFKDLSTTVFNLTDWPLYRVEAYRTADDRAVLGLCLHHIAGDAWSLRLLTNELLEVYDQVQQGETPSLPLLSNDYRAAVDLQTSLENALPVDQLEAQRAYWTKIMSELPNLTPPPELTGNGQTGQASVTLVLPATVKEKLGAYCREERTTLFYLFLALYARALGRLYQSDDILAGVAVSGRDLPLEGVGQIVGCFARNLPVRLPVIADLQSTLRATEKAFLDALEHQQLPPREFFRIASGEGRRSIFSIYRHFFSFMDFTALKAPVRRSLTVDWDAADYFFQSGAGTELMAGVAVAGQIRIQIHGRAPAEVKERLAALMKEEIDRLTGSATALDAALIAYLPGPAGLQRMAPAGWSDPGLLNGLKKKVFPGREPRLLEYQSTAYGTSGLVFLPSDADELTASSREDLVTEIVKAIRLAAHNGARIVSLAGILPARTNYGFSILHALERTEIDPAGLVLTTGHACTVVAVVKTVEKILAATGTEIGRLNVAAVGFGSIGQASASLLLSVLGAPASIVVVDLAEQLPALEKPLLALRQNYPGPVSVAAATREGVPPAVYSADLIIGASSSGQIIEVEKLRPGTILVDDSFPSVIAQGPAIRRMQEKQDVLLAGGGKLDLGEAARKLLVDGLPEGRLEQWIQAVGAEGFPGCRAEPLLMRLDKTLPPTIGLVQPEAALRYWRKATEWGIAAVELHLAGYEIPGGVISRVRELWQG